MRGTGQDEDAVPGVFPHPLPGLSLVEVFPVGHPLAGVGGVGGVIIAEGDVQRQLLGHRRQSPVPGRSLTSWRPCSKEPCAAGHVQGMVSACPCRQVRVSSRVQRRVAHFPSALQPCSLPALSPGHCWILQAPRLINLSGGHYRGAV